MPFSKSERPSAKVAAMREPPNGRSPAAGGRDRASIIITGKVNNPLDSTPTAGPQPFRAIGELIEVVLGSLRTPTEAEQRELRAMWWRQRRLGHTLPAEPGLIVLDGGGP